MFYKASKLSRVALAAIALAATSGTAAADVLVAQSSGAAARTYPRGTRLADDASIVLGRGDRVSVLTPRGMQRFEGPGRFRVGGARQLASSALASGRRSQSVARTGVSRGRPPARAGETVPVDHPMYRKVWQVNVAETGPFCYVAGQPVSLWRADAEAPATLTLTRGADRTSRTIEFAENQWAHEWPADFAAEAGAEYLLSWAGAEAPVRVIFQPLATDATDQVAVGAALLESGCEAQLDALVDRATREQEAAGESG